jgi:serine phosphatase RsbU (regulator of sigma subunit)
LAHKDFLEEELQEHFVFFHPKDIVSGDFYWAASTGSATKRKFYIAACDSTGHGVPGAFMSLLNIGYLNEAIKEKGIEKAQRSIKFCSSALDR